jgi:CHAT domain-containing protein
LVASLWPVKDDTTARFMTNFYARLHQASSVASALREAQLELRQQHPNPYYWAAFTLTGDPQRTVVI